jgi:hypothetical protein
VDILLEVVVDTQKVAVVDNLLEEVVVVDRTLEQPGIHPDNYMNLQKNYLSTYDRTLSNFTLLGYGIVPYGLYPCGIGGGTNDGYGVEVEAPYGTGIPCT